MTRRLTPDSFSLFEEIALDSAETFTDPRERVDLEEHFVLDFANRCSHLGYELPFDSPEATKS